ncbi:F-box-like domain-containing protein [Rutstroemia sp. NJR-2017a BBW]|nr:F-box-like domain-containing protein [Rutstroemia sp. NJR-2017a BBW]
MTTASTPVTPGPSTPTILRPLLPSEQKKVDAILNIERPASTPFPRQELLDGEISQRRGGLETLEWMEEQPPIPEPEQQPPTPPESGSFLCALPVEIHEHILDHLFGCRAAASARTMTPGKSKVLRNWGTALRHSRRREVSELALVSAQWRNLIQERLYRHLKIKGTRDSIDQASEWFYAHPHLCEYVKHIEIWFPVFQTKKLPIDRILRIPSVVPDRSTLIRSLATLGQEAATSVTYQSPSNNCALDEIFGFVRTTFAEACILTLEGGDRKKPPQVQRFSRPDTTTQLPVVDGIRTLVCKGQWNIIRTDEDFQIIAAALPNLNEWHGSYAKPKSKAYLCIAQIAPRIPENITHLNICLENDYRREATTPAFFRKVAQKTHFCNDLAKAIPTLEHLAYTGRVCHTFFDTAARLSNRRTSRLKSVELIVKNCCRPTMQWNDGSGISDMTFILAFEALVVSAVKALDKLTALDYLRIRFIDLESQVPPLNPYFEMVQNRCTGIWSTQIVDELAKSRSSAYFVEKAETLGEVEVGKDGQFLTGPTFSKTRPLSIKVSSYLTLTGGSPITIT